MEPVAPRPIPASITSVPDQEGWTSAQLATVRERYTQDELREHGLVAVAPAVDRAFQFDDDRNANAPTFQHVGTDLHAAIAAAREIANRTFSGDDDFQSQAVLQAASGAFYVAGLGYTDRTQVDFDVDASDIVGVVDLHEDVRAIVGRTNWIPAPGVEA